MTLASGKYDAHCRKMGVRVASEGFADRAYEVDGTLVSRRKPGALITDPARAAAQAVRMAAEGKVRTIDGVDIDLSVQTICCHGDTPGRRAHRPRGARGAGGGGRPGAAAPGVAPVERPGSAPVRRRDVRLLRHARRLGGRPRPGLPSRRLGGRRRAWSGAAILQAYMAVEREVEAGPYRPYREVLAEIRARRRGPPGLAARPRPRGVPRRQRARRGSRSPTPTPRSSGCARPATRSASSRTSTTTCSGPPGGTSRWSSSSWSPPSRCARTSRRAPHFEAARRAIGARRWLHVGQGYFHDVVPARALGLPTAWINRNGDAPFDGGRGGPGVPHAHGAGRLAGAGRIPARVSMPRE